MKLNNKQIINFLTKEFGNINVRFDILQKRHKYKSNFYRGYIYI